MMGGILAWLIIGVLLYFLFSKRGGLMGCCGGHNHHSSEDTNGSGPYIRRFQRPDDEIIDLKKEDYHVRNES